MIAHAMVFILGVLIGVLVHWALHRARAVASGPEPMAQLKGVVVKGDQLARKMDYPTINLATQGAKPGIYTADSSHGSLIAIITSNTHCECHFLKFHPEIDKLQTLEIRNFVPITTPSEQSFINVFNDGLKYRGGG